MRRFRGLRRIAAVVAIDLAVGVAATAPLASTTQHQTAAPAGATTAAPATGDSFGDATSYGSMQGKPLAQPVVGIDGTHTGKGYWLVARDGGIFSFGDATFYGSTGAMRLNQPIVGITATPTGKGYWFVAADGGVFSFGDAQFKGSTGAIRLNQPIVGMASTPTGKGYWLVASDGGIFAFGDAGFHGSTGGLRLNQPISGMASSPTGKGYWLVSRDGGVFAFGDAVSRGSAAGRAGQPVVGMATAADGDGYWLGTTDGAVFAFGEAASFGAASTLSPVVGIASTPTGLGYWLVTAEGGVLTSAAPAVPSGSYAFLRIGKDGVPVRYDPCQDQHYVINPLQAPAGAVDEVRTAFARLSAATGIRFVDDGTTTETHSAFGERDITQARYGDRWAPILVSWTSAAVEPLLAGGTLGYGGSTSYWRGDTDEAYVSGEVVFDTDQTALTPGFGAGLTRGNLVLHELGHVVGLDHVGDRSQLLYASIHQSSPNGFAAGDLAGLAQLGARSGCLNVATPV
ncbi:MAG TPA: matrixin family metalloprotease [Acidimicrobiales bacterium]|nr:matrixin family metalloprotease [Acidimicrobiales bacterium]